MAASADLQLEQMKANAASRHGQSLLGRYEQASQNKPVGMLSMPNTDLPMFTASQFGSFKTPQPQQPESGGMSVMCSLMHEYGYIDDDVIEVDNLFGKLLYETNPEIIVGYHAWAKPLANFLRHHAIYIPLFAYIVQAWAYEMAEQFGIVKNRSTFKRLVGKIVMNVGKPVCGFIGTVISLQGIYEYHRT